MKKSNYGGLKTSAMPSKLSTLVSKISAIPNYDNAKIIDEFYHYMKENGSSETIVRDLLDNELAGGNTYSTDALTKIIKEKYYPPANDAIVNGVFDKLAAQISRVASITKGTCGNPVT